MGLAARFLILLRFGGCYGGDGECGPPRIQNRALNSYSE